MQHVRRVNVLQTAQNLIQKVADMLVANRLSLKELVQVGLHEALHNVHVLHLIDSGRSYHVLYVDDVFVFEAS